MTEREALLIALEALEDAGKDDFWRYQDKAITAIKEALAQPEQEPFAWADLNALSEQINSVNCGTVYRLPSEAENRQPLYTTPPQRKPLTEQECIRLAKTVAVNKHQIRAIEAAHGIKELKEAAK